MIFGVAPYSDLPYSGLPAAGGVVTYEWAGSAGYIIASDSPFLKGRVYIASVGEVLSCAGDWNLAKTRVGSVGVKLATDFTYFNARDVILTGTVGYKVGLSAVKQKLKTYDRSRVGVKIAVAFSYPIAINVNGSEAGLRLGLDSPFKVEKVSEQEGVGFKLGLSSPVELGFWNYEQALEPLWLPEDSLPDGWTAEATLDPNWTEEEELE